MHASLCDLCGLGGVRAQLTMSGKVLVGKWEGDIQKSGTTHVKGRGQELVDNTRILVIERIREQDGKWIVEKAGNGEEGKKLGTANVSLEVSGSDVRVTVETKSGTTLNLKLVDGPVLAGTWKAKTNFYKIEVKKIE